MKIETTTTNIYHTSGETQLYLFVTMKRNFLRLKINASNQILNYDNEKEYLKIEDKCLKPDTQLLLR